MRCLPVVSELDLDLQRGEINRIVLPNGMSSIQNGLLGLLVQEVELDRVTWVNISVGIEVFPLQKKNVCFDNTLFSKCFAVVHPVH